MQKQNQPVGVFDSGIGGVSVLKNLVHLLPNENFLYLGDSKNAPYGTKSHEEIFVHAEDCARYLISKGVKALVVACNTATSVCVEDLRDKYSHSIPIVGIEPALKPAVNSAEHPVVVVMATPLTLKEKKFASLCEKFAARAEIIPLPCPGLMELIEAGHISDEKAEQYLKECFLKTGVSSFDAIVLGCTHYPFVKDIIARLHPEAKIYDGGEGTARQLKRLLEQDNLLTESNLPGTVIFENTLGSGEINNLAQRLLTL